MNVVSKVFFVLGLGTHFVGAAFVFFFGVIAAYIGMNEGFSEKEKHIWLILTLYVILSSCNLARLLVENAKIGQRLSTIVPFLPSAGLVLYIGFMPFRTGGSIVFGIVLLMFEFLFVCSVAHMFLARTTLRKREEKE